MRFENAVLIFSQILRQISGRNFDEINIFTFYTPILLFISISQIFSFLKILKRETKFSTDYPFLFPPSPLSQPTRPHPPRGLFTSHMFSLDISGVSYLLLSRTFLDPSTSGSQDLCITEFRVLDDPTDVT